MPEQTLMERRTLKNILHPIIYIHIFDEDGKFESVEHLHSHCGLKGFDLKVELIPTDFYEQQIQKTEDSLYGTWLEACKLQYANRNKEDLYYTPKVNEEKAEFPGGEPELQLYLMEHSRIPDQNWLKEKDQGRVNFVVEPDGAISHVHVVDAKDPEIEKELKRIFWNMPNWTPKKVDQQVQRSVKSVRVQFVLID